MAAAFDVEDSGGAGLALQDVLRIQNKLAIRPDDFPGWGDHAQPVGIAIEGQAQLAVVFLYVLDQVLQVARVGRVGVMVGKASVDLAVQLVDLAAQDRKSTRLNSSH